MTASRIGVLIPYYQRTPEPLMRALKSIERQTVGEPVHVFIVDDESPCPAEPIVSQHFSHFKNIHILQQKNGGAGHARNTGLDHLPESIELVAFLDSDDEWTPDHLAHAVMVHDRGYDFYFADHKRDDWDTSRFAMATDLLAHQPCLDQASALHEYRDDALSLVLGRNMIKTSSVAVRRSLVRNIRFPVNVVMGEDEAFWMRVLHQTCKVAYCASVEVWMGSGVNISQGGEWGNERSFQLMAHRLQFWKQIHSFVPDVPGLHQMRTRKRQELRKDFAGSVLYRLRRLQGIPVGPLAHFMLQDPLWLLSLAALMTRKLRGTSHS